MDAPAPCASTDVLWSCTVCCNKEQTTKEHICVGPSFVIFRHLSLCERSKSSPAQTLQPCPPKQKISYLQMCVLCLSLFSLFDQCRCWIASLYYYFPPSFPLLTTSYIHTIYNFSHYFPPLLSSLNHVQDSWYICS